MKEELLNNNFLKHIIFCFTWGFILAIIATLLTPIINFLLAFFTTTIVTTKMVNWALLFTWSIWYIRKIK